MCQRSRNWFVGAFALVVLISGAARTKAQDPGKNSWTSTDGTPLAIKMLAGLYDQLELGMEGTVELWLKADQDLSSSNTDIPVVTVGDDASGVAYRVLLTPDRKALRLVGNPDDPAARKYSLPASCNLADNNWHHIAFVVCGTASHAYVDKVRSPADTAFFFPPPTAAVRPLTFGGPTFKGSVRTLRCWSKALNELEIGWLYNSPAYAQPKWQDAGVAVAAGRPNPIPDRHQLAVYFDPSTSQLGYARPGQLFLSAWAGNEKKGELYFAKRPAGSQVVTLWAKLAGGRVDDLQVEYDNRRAAVPIYDRPADAPGQRNLKFNGTSFRLSVPTILPVQLGADPAALSSPWSRAVRLRNLLEVTPPATAVPSTNFEALATSVLAYREAALGATDGRQGDSARKTIFTLREDDLVGIWGQTPNSKVVYNKLKPLEEKPFGSKEELSAAVAKLLTAAEWTKVQERRPFYSSFLVQWPAYRPDLLGLPVAGVERREEILGISGFHDGKVIQQVRFHTTGNKQSPMFAFSSAGAEGKRQPPGQQGFNLMVPDKDKDGSPFAQAPRFEGFLIRRDAEGVHAVALAYRIAPSPDGSDAPGHKVAALNLTQKRWIVTEVRAPAGGDNTVVNSEGWKERAQREIFKTIPNPYKPDLSALLENQLKDVKWHANYQTHPVYCFRYDNTRDELIMIRELPGPGAQHMVNFTVPEQRGRELSTQTVGQLRFDQLDAAMARHDPERHLHLSIWGGLQVRAPAAAPAALIQKLKDEAAQLPDLHVWDMRLDDSKCSDQAKQFTPVIYRVLRNRLIQMANSEERGYDATRVQVSDSTLAFFENRSSDPLGISVRVAWKDGSMADRFTQDADRMTYWVYTGSFPAIRTAEQLITAAAYKEEVKLKSQYPGALTSWHRDPVTGSLFMIAVPGGKEVERPGIMSLTTKLARLPGIEGRVSEGPGPRLIATGNRSTITSKLRLASELRGKGPITSMAFKHEQDNVWVTADEKQVRTRLIINKEDGTLDVTHRLNEPTGTLIRTTLTVVRPPADATAIADGNGKNDKLSWGATFAQDKQLLNIRAAFRGYDLTEMNHRNLMAAHGTVDQGKYIFSYPAENSLAFAPIGNLNIPYGFVAQTLNFGEAKTSTRYSMSAAEDHQQYSQALGISSGVNKVYSFSANTTLQNEVKHARENSTLKTTQRIVAQNYALIVDRSLVQLDPNPSGFRARVLAFRDRYRRGEQPKLSDYKALFSQFGTHYLYASIYGGSYTRSMHVTSSEFSDMHKQGVELKVDAELGSKKTANVGAKSETKYELDTTRKEEGRHESEKAFEYGGEVSRDGWSCPDNKLVPVLMDLRPLYDLLSPLYFDDPIIWTKLRDDMEYALESYCAEALRKNNPIWAQSETPIPWARRDEKGRIHPR